jgi:DUF4097 and DUF4098 domain-containing protein YvlB
VLRNASLSVAISLSTACLASAAFAETESKQFDAATIKVVEIANGEGSVTLNAGAVAKVDAEKVKFGKDCELTLAQEGERLVVKVEHKKSLFSSLRGDCEVNLTVTVPASVDTKLRVGSGDAKLAGLKGAVAFESGSGDVAIDGEIAKLEGKTGSGEVTVKGLTAGDVDVKVGSGEIDLAWLKAPSEGKVSLTAGSGDVTVRLPADAKVRTHLRAGSGTVSNELGETADAKLDISATIGSGDLAIKKL